ncbi:unnamed protein product [Calypogeia fissa]
MSSCDCDRKDSNGGTCDSSCKEESFGVVQGNSSPVSYAPVLAVSKAAGLEAVVSFEGRVEYA